MAVIFAWLACPSSMWLVAQRLSTASRGREVSRYSKCAGRIDCGDCCLDCCPRSTERGGSP
eukprot:301784-Amphidinium_carterae.1